MKNRPIVTILFSLLFLAACAPVATPAPTATAAATVVPTATAAPSITPDKHLPGPSSMMLEEDFESAESAFAFPYQGDWALTQDGNENTMYCNSGSVDWMHFRLGSTTWRNYAVEIHMKFMGDDSDQSAEVYSRINTGYEGYRSSLGIGWGGIGYYPPPQSLTNFSLSIQSNTWYVLKVETFGSQVRFSIDGMLMSQVTDNQSLEGMAGFGVSPNTSVCVDNLKVWALTETGDIGDATITLHPKLELVTDQAVTGDGENRWGGHQTRIVRTDEGVFTAYTVEGGGHFAREWHLAWRQDDGTWLVIAKGGAGREPVNLLASPDGMLHVIGYPNGIATIFSGKLKNGQLMMESKTIPAVSSPTNPYWPYNSAGIDSQGNLCVLSSVGGETPGGKFQVACYLSSQGKWITEIVPLDYRYCYTYVFPGSGGKVSLVSTRDVLWSALGYSQPEGAFDYVFNAVGIWHTDDISSEPIKQIYFMEELPNESYPYVHRNATEDAYVDTIGNIHILYKLQGASTLGRNVNRHAILSPGGDLLADVELPAELGEFVRILQNANGKFFLLGSSGVLYPAGADGLMLGTPIIIDLKSYVVEYNGFGISSPRTGTPSSNIVDVVYPSGDGFQWIYFQIILPTE